MNSQVRDISLWKGQFTHILCLIILLTTAFYSWRIVGKPSPVLFWFAILVPVVHQAYVWITWRLELKYSLISKKFGFRLYLIGFFALFLSRFVSLVLIGWADEGSLGLDPEQRVFLTLGLLVPGLYAMYSVKRYFGLSRAAGADHFESKYQSMPAVKKGIFRFTSNGMYLYAFLLFWAIATSFSSNAALIVAFFSHIYIWVHHYCTERPDMETIYGNSI